MQVYVQKDRTKRLSQPGSTHLIVYVEYSRIFLLFG